MGYKICHVSDTHIKNLKYHYEYGVVFEQLYQKLRDEKVDYIIHTGDIAHTKTQISPEFVELCSDFFRNLEAIAPTYVILGNHDANLKNNSRQDALSPIVSALNLPNLHLLKDAGETVLRDDLALNVLSRLDEDNWVAPSDPTRINIALYHGAIAGVSTDIGWVMDHGDHTVDIFAGHDYAMLGDIHKTNQILDLEGRVRYAGSTVQQNHGETNDKGFLIWNIEDKDTFTVDHHVLLNPKPFVTIELTPKGRIPKGTDISTGSRLRLVSNNNLPLDVMRKAVDVAKTKFRPESVTFLNRAAGKRGEVDIVGGFKTENLRDPAVQEDLIKEYLTDYEPEDEVLEKIYQLNRKFNNKIAETDDVARNVNWSINKFKWDNLFNYGEKNEIDFTNLNGIVGIFGKNYSGKSSVVDSLLYTLYNTTSKNERKNYNVINQNRQSASGEVELQIGDKVLTVTRESEKYVKKLKGVETNEAKTTLDFTVVDEIGNKESLNGNTRNETDKNIRRQFGSIDDFLLTSMASQLDSLAFIKEGSTKRKEILARFLDLDVFETKFKMAKEESADLKALLRRIGETDYNTDIAIAEVSVEQANADLAIKTAELAGLKTVLEEKKAELAVIENKISSIPDERIDIKNLLAEKKKVEASIKVHSDEILTCKQSNEELKAKIAEIESFLTSVDIDDLRDKKESYETNKSAYDDLVASAKSLKSEYDRKKKRLVLLDEVPCGNEYSSCKFIKDAHGVKVELPGLEERIVSSIAEAKQQKALLELVNVSELASFINKYVTNSEKKITHELTIKDNNLCIERNSNKVNNLNETLERIESDIRKYESNKQVIQNIENLMSQKAELQASVKRASSNVDSKEEEINEQNRLVGSLENRVESLEEKRDELEDIRNEFAAYDLFMRCMHSNGIAYDIIKKRLPIINEEISKVISNIVDFDVFFKEDGNKLDILIKHPKHEPRPIEMGSGAEKTIASMGIRLALLSVSSLPRPSIFILDEPGTALDAENMEGFIRILQLVKMYFKTVILISHLDSLKDAVDQEIVIDKIDGYAKINQ